MYEFLVTSAAGVKQKNRILFILCVALLCIILAVAMPLRVYAVATVVTALVTFIVGSVVATGVSSALMALGVGVVVAVIAGMAAGLSASMLITAVQAQVDNGNWAAFVDTIKDKVTVGNSTFTAENPTIFSYCVDWVKTHILGFFDEVYEPTVSNTIYNCPVMTTNVSNSDLPTWLSNNCEVLGTVSFSAADITNSAQNDVIKTVTGVYTNPDTNVSVEFENRYTLTRSFGYPFVISDYIYSCNGNVVSHRITRLYDNIDITNKNFVSYYPYLQNITSNIDWLLDKIVFDGSLFTGTESWTYNNNVLTWDRYGDLIRVKIGGVNKNINVTYNDTTQTSFYQIPAFLSKIYLNGSTVTIVDSDVEPVVTNPTYNTTVVNNYYTANKDIVSSISNTAKGAVDSGAITNEAAGAISISISDAISATEVGADTIVGEATAVSDVSISSELADVAPIGIFPALVIAGNNIKLGFGDLRYKFPFDVIPAVADWLQALVTPGEPLEIHYTFNVPFGAQTKVIHVDIDFAQYQTLVTVGNWIVLVSTAIGLLLASKKAFQFL